MFGYARFIMMVLFFWLVIYNQMNIIELMQLHFTYLGEQHLGVSKVCAGGGYVESN